MQAVGILIAIFVALPLLFIEQAWVISTLWQWFVVPLGLPHVGIATAIGVSLLVSVLRMGRKTNKFDSKGESYTYLATIFLMPLIAVAIGWVVKHFV